MSVPPPPAVVFLPRPLRFLPAMASGAAICVGLLVLAGWTFDIELLKRISPTLVAMNPLTAVLFILSGGAFAIFLCGAGGRASTLMTRILAVAIVWPAVMKLLSLAGESPYIIDTWLFASKLTSAPGELPNRMAPNTAVNFLVTGLALLSLHPPKTRLWLGQACAILIGFGALLPLGGYAYGVHSFTGFASFIPMALHTAITFLILALGIFFAIPEAPLPQLFATKDPRGAIARQFLPLSILMTLFLGWLRLWGERQGYFETEFGTLLFAISLCLLLVLLVRWTVWTVTRLERARGETQARFDEMNRRKDEMYALVSHDLSTPLTGFQMVLEKLRAEKGPPSSELLNLMDHSARRMASMVRELVDTSKEQQPAEVQLEYTELHLSDVVRQSMEPLLITAQAKQIRFDLEVAADEPSISVDQLRVSQIFNNLLANAFKFTGDGGRVHVKVEPAFLGVKVQIKDSGAGISENDLPHIFDRYYQGSARATAGELSSGLGLAVAREMATLHNGYIQVASEPGEGATFTVYLPLGLHEAAA